MSFPPNARGAAQTRYQAPAASELVGSFVNQELGEKTAQVPKTQVSRSAQYGLGRNLGRVAIDQDGNNPFAASARRQSQGALDWQKRMNAMEAQRLNAQRQAASRAKPQAGRQPAGGNYTGSTVSQNAKGVRGQIVGLAQTYVGRPYVLGGNSYAGIDCSGLVQQVYKKFGYNFPRLANQQRETIPGIRTSVNNLKPGDLVVWPDPNGHIAIYAGNGEVIQAANPSMGVIRNRLADQYDKRFYGIALQMPGD